MKIRLTENDIKYMVKEVLNELMMSEANLLLSEPVKGEPVCMFVGRFQPFTKGHLSCLEWVWQKYGLKTFILTSHGNGTPEKPIQGEAQVEMLNRIQNNHSDLIAGLDYGFGAAIDKNVDLIRRHGFEPVLWVTGSDHEAVYSRMANNEEYKRLLKLAPDFKLVIHPVPRDPNGEGVAAISGTKAREAIMTGNFEEFSRMVPNELHDIKLFNTFQNCLANIQVKPKKRS